MKLGVNLSYLDAVQVSQEAERLGFDLAVVPEGFRADGATVLGAVAAATTRIGLASGVFQLPGRTPAMTALTASTLDTLSGGRFRLGLGVSNPDISEGWHGVPFRRPLARTREYVDIVRRTLAREPVTHQGEHFRLPPEGCTASPLRLFSEPVAERLPIYLAAVAPGGLELAGEIADGWLGAFSPPDELPKTMESLRAGRLRAGLPLSGFEVLCGIPMALGSDVEAAAAPIRGYLSHFLGMGNRGRNIYVSLFERLGYGPETGVIHERMAAGDPHGAAAAVPAGLVDRISLLGDQDRVAARMRAYAEQGVSTLVISPFGGTTDERIQILRVAAAALGRAGLAA
ncbi:LLM class flavin-dependent oxidoreductase [Nonomuraea sp. MG754425]|uniref:LLM class flavin-dependent oxidoreductase n=1 Tax=Nonomuraea sp. MG754425 TaxID=2570319 RepID=UPI001F23C5C4|nr:LLM class flavin-dependent oxidoreductase [Nonomuraea sp. MG754425]MCF6470022.1 LLM class flavin-dependent oxidoreductase [Nonomuraea sp. MG754425]